MSATKKLERTGVHQKAFRGLVHTFIPRTGNGFHPHLIRPVGLAIVFAMVGLLHLLSNVPDAGSVKGASTEFSKQSLLVESNRVRLESDVGMLNLNDDLSAAAGLKARDMLVRQYWAHTAPDGTTPWYWYREVNYRYDYAGENLAKGFDTAPAVLTAWMNSEEHRKNALSSDYQDVGFGVAEGTLDGQQTTVVVALYGSPLGTPTLTKSEVLAASDGSLSPIARFGIGLQSLSPMMLGSIVLLGVTTIVALGAQLFSKRLPVNIRRTWKRHQSLYKAVGTACLILLLITLYGDGQIL
jgi:hypothetical protein